MEIGKYKQALSHLLKDDPLKNITFNSEARLIDNDPTSLVETFAKGGVVDGGSVERQGFEKGGDVKNTFYNLKKKLKRNPTVFEISKQISKNFNDLSYEEKKSIYDKVIYTGKKENLNFYKTSGQPTYQLSKQIGDVNFPVATKTGIKWPSKKIKDEYEQQIINRYKYAKSSVDLEEQRKLGNLLTNEQLAKNFNINKRGVERLNEQIIKEYNLKKTQPIIGREEVQKTRDIKRKEAQLKFSDPGFEQKVKGTYKAHLGHMGDLYNRIVTSQNLGYTPSEINSAMSETLDPILRKISESQDKLIKNKPPGWKQKLEEYNKKGINYSSLAEGYKSFDIIDPNTLKKYTYGVDYLKTIDPAALYEGKPIKELAELTNKKQINKIKKAFDDLNEAKQIAKKQGLKEADISNIKNSELLTEENLRKLQNYKAFEKNRETILKSQSNIKPLLKKQIIESIGNNINELPSDKKAEIVSIAGGCSLKYADGGRVKFSEGGDCYIRGLKNLEEGNLGEKEINAIAQSLKEDGMLSKQFETSIDAFKTLARGGKNALNLIQDLVIGRGPFNLALTAGLQGGFALNDLSEGKRGSEALSNASFGLLGKSHEDILKGIGGPEVDKGLKMRDDYERLKTLADQWNNVEDEVRSSYGPEDVSSFEETGPMMIKKRKEDIKKEYNSIFNKLEPHLDENGNLKQNAPGYKDLLKAEKLDQKEKDLRVNIGQSKANEWIKTESGEPLNIDEETKKRMEYIAQLKQQEKNYFENQNKETEDLTDYSQLSMADGGRVKLEGGGGPKMGRRGFLGLLAGAAAAAPELLKSIKGGSQVAKVASKIKLEPAQGMYSWFPDLVEKIKIKGKPFEEPYTTMEASYKHEARGYGGLPKGEEKLTRHIDGDTEFVLREYPDGRIAVDIHSPRNQEGLDTPVTLYYRPKMELQYHTGKKIEPAEFKVLEKEPRYFANGPDDVDIEMSEKVKTPGRDTIFGDIEAAERFATGDIKNRKVIPTKQSIRNQMEDAPVDFIESHTPYGSYDPPTEILE